MTKLTLREAGELLGISRSTVTYHMLLGHLGRESYEIRDGRRTTLLKLASVEKFQREFAKLPGGRWRRMK